MVTRKELISEINILQKFGLTLEEIEGYLGFYEDIFKIEDLRYRTIQVLNTKGLKKMTIYKSAAEEIAENMARFLEKSSSFPINWEYFKKTVDNARRCEDLQTPWRWIEGGKTGIYQDRAFQYFLQKEKELKSNFGSNCQTR